MKKYPDEYVDFILARKPALVEDFDDKYGRLGPFARQKLVLDGTVRQENGVLTLVAADVG